MHKRNDSGAVKRRRENALARWKANRDRGYQGVKMIYSDSLYVEAQIGILQWKLAPIDPIFL